MTTAELRAKKPKIGEKEGLNVGRVKKLEAMSIKRMKGELDK